MTSMTADGDLRQANPLEGVRVLELTQGIAGPYAAKLFAIMGATAFVKGLGAMHALSHAIGALCNTQHGLTNAVLLVPVLEFNRPAIEKPVAALARDLGLAANFDAYVAAVRRLAALPNPTVPASTALENGRQAMRDLNSMRQSVDLIETVEANAATALMRSLNDLEQAVDAPTE